VEEGRGVTRLDRVRAEPDVEDVVEYGTPEAERRLTAAFADVTVIGVDPGQVIAVSAHEAPGLLWRPERMHRFVSGAEERGVRPIQVTGDWVRATNKATKNENAEAARREVNRTYRLALEAQSQQHIRTCDVAVRSIERYMLHRVRV
jgi:hypothetical protein